MSKMETTVKMLRLLRNILMCLLGSIGQCIVVKSSALRYRYRCLGIRGDHDKLFLLFPSACLSCYTCLFPAISPMDCVKFPQECPAGQRCLSSTATGTRGEICERVNVYTGAVYAYESIFLESEAQWSKTAGQSLQLCCILWVLALCWSPLTVAEAK